uniref:Uncharacterized protein n=1 Tax=Arundo donax TaxID=35708 RepID=A0A0A9GTS3_ARUDO
MVVFPKVHKFVIFKKVLSRSLAPSLHIYAQRKLLLVCRSSVHCIIAFCLLVVSSGLI